MAYFAGLVRALKLFIYFLFSQNKHRGASNVRK